MQVNDDTEESNDVNVQSFIAVRVKECEKQRQKLDKDKSNRIKSQIKQQEKTPKNFLLKSHWANCVVCGNLSYAFGKTFFFSSLFGVLVQMQKGNNEKEKWKRMKRMSSNEAEKKYCIESSPKLAEAHQQQ